MAVRIGVSLAVLIAACNPNVPNQARPDAAPPLDGPVPCVQSSLELAAATLAGCEQSGTTDGTRAAARFNNPTNVQIAPDGTVYVTDFENGLVRRIEPDGHTTTMFGARDDFKVPFGIALAPDGTLFVETDDDDTGAHSIDTGTIWRVDPATGTATVVARDLGRPRGLAMLPDGRIAMADHQHHTISILDPATGAVVPLAGGRDLPGHANGTGAEARFAQPYDIVVLPDGDLAVSDYDNHQIRRVTLAGVVTDLAGSGVAGNIDGPLANATFDAPQGLAVSGDALYVTDVHRFFVRRIANGAVTTVAGSGLRGHRDADDPRAAAFYGMEGLDADATRLVIADGNIGDGGTFHRIRVVSIASLP